MFNVCTTVLLFIYAFIYFQNFPPRTCLQWTKESMINQSEAPSYILGTGRQVQKWMKVEKGLEACFDFAFTITTKAIFCHVSWQPHLLYSLGGGCQIKEKYSIWNLWYKFCLESEFVWRKVKQLRVNEGDGNMNINGYQCCQSIFRHWELTIIRLGRC